MKTLLVVAVLMFFVLCGVAFHLNSVVENEWTIFSAAHSCRIVARISGSSSVASGVGMGANGQVGMVTGAVSIPDKTGWLCDDGVTYFR